MQKGTSTLSGLEDLRIEERLQRYIFGSAEEMNSHRRRNASGSNAERSQSDTDKECTIDGYSINRDMTSPGAILALGLMYIKSGWVHSLSYFMSHDRQDDVSFFTDLLNALLVAIYQLQEF